MSEIGKGAVMYFNDIGGNTDEAKLSRSMGVISRDKNLRSELITAGKNNAQSFTWDKTARETAAIYRRLFNGESVAHSTSIDS